MDTSTMSATDLLRACSVEAVPADDGETFSYRLALRLPGPALSSDELLAAVEQWRDRLARLAA